MRNRIRGAFYTRVRRYFASLGLSPQETARATRAAILTGWCLSDYAGNPYFVIRSHV